MGFAPTGTGGLVIRVPLRRSNTQAWRGSREKYRKSVGDDAGKDRH